jgi:hypothetical protein
MDMVNVPQNMIKVSVDMIQVLRVPGKSISGQCESITGHGNSIHGHNTSPPGHGKCIHGIVRSLWRRGKSNYSHV